MQPSDAPMQENRSDQVTFRVTPMQKQAVRFVAAALGKTEPDLLHERVIPGIVEEAEQMRARLAGAA